MDAAHRRRALQRGKPEPPFRGEPLLGGWYTDEEVDAVNRALRDSMDWHTGFGFMVQEIADFEQAFADYCGVKHAVSINGAGAGLDMAMMCLDLQPGDEVICAAVNFKAAPLSVLGQGGRVVYAEIDPRTFNLDPNDVERRLTPRTRAIYPTHMNGLSAPIDDYLEIAERHPHPEHGPLKVIGDAARACGGGYKGTKIGKKGWMTVFSFHTQKLMTTLGEGGAVTTDDDEAARRLRGIRQFGAGTEEWGTNYKMTKVQAAVGSVQVRRLDEMLARRRALAERRLELLADIPQLTLPYEPPDCVHTYYLFTILVPREWAGDKRDLLVRIMDEEYGIGCTIANPPVYYGSPYLRKHTADQASGLPVSEEIGKRLFCLSLHPLMTEEDNEYICAALWETVERLQKS